LSIKSLLPGRIVLTICVLLPGIALSSLICCAAVEGPYRLHAGDVLQITVAGHPELTFDSQNSIQIRPDGKFSYPYASAIVAEGRTVEEVTDSLVAALEDYLLQPNVAVNVIRYHARQIYVLGEVGKPGAYSLPQDRPVGVREAIALAEGLTPSASREAARLFRTGQAPELIDLRGVLAGDSDDPTFVLQPGDTIVIERRNLVSVVGQVESPGNYQLPDNSRISDALAAARGFARTLEGGATRANKAQAILVRADRSTVTVNLAAILSGEHPEADIKMHTGDTLLILEATNQVAVLGEVGEAGSYYLSQSEELSTVLAMAGGVTSKADLQNIRLLSPDGTVCTINYEPVLRQGAEGPHIQCGAGDTVIVPINRSRVAVFGAVSSPGVYTVETDDTLLDMIGKAGGVAEKSAPEHTLVMRHDATSGQPQRIDLQSIMEGQGSPEQLVVQDGDIIFVPESKELEWRDWTDIFSSVANFWWLLGRF